MTRGKTSHETLWNALRDLPDVVLVEMSQFRPSVTRAEMHSRVRRMRFSTPHMFETVLRMFPALAKDDEVVVRAIRHFAPTAKLYARDSFPSAERMGDVSGHYFAETIKRIFLVNTFDPSTALVASLMRGHVQRRPTRY